MAQRPSHHIQITRDGSNTLYSERYEQTFHSIHGAHRESLHVFLDGSGVAARLHQQMHTAVLEVGFGTGLNFLLTADAALQSGATLEFWSLEQELLTSEVVRSLAFEAYMQRQDFFQTFLAWLHTVSTTVNTSSPAQFTFENTITLHLLLGEATEIPLPQQAMHAVYQDAFSPNVNPELWTSPFFCKLHTAMLPGACLSTYSARKLVRENLKEAGFSVQKKPGPPGKREMVVACKSTVCKSTTLSEVCSKQPILSREPSQFSSPFRVLRSRPPGPSSD